MARDRVAVVSTDEAGVALFSPFGPTVADDPVVDPTLGIRPKADDINRMVDFSLKARVVQNPAFVVLPIGSIDSRNNRAVQGNVCCNVSLVTQKNLKIDDGVLECCRLEQ
jgi:hypothetical protein